MRKNRKIKPRSVSRNLAVWLVFSAFFISAAVISFNCYSASKRMRMLLENKADDYISFVTASLEIPLWNMDRETAKNVAMSYTRNDWIAMLRQTSVTKTRRHVTCRMTAPMPSAPRTAQSGMASTV